jgi:CDP-diacylglycerol--glycerol-3-phosphate 3-phosphatidyltransferase
MTLPNIISLMRLPLALAFLQENSTLRLLAVIVAGLTDALDGFLARRYGQSSRLGTILDPLTDKIFVLTALTVFFFENKLTFPEVLTMLSRDFAVIIFGVYLVCKGVFSFGKVEAFWCGKVFTALQLFVLLALVLGVKLPVWFFGIFVVLGVMSLVELSFRYRKG